MTWIDYTEKKPPHNDIYLVFALDKLNDAFIYTTSFFEGGDPVYNEFLPVGVDLLARYDVNGGRRYEVKKWSEFKGAMSD